MRAGHRRSRVLSVPDLDIDCAPLLCTNIDIEVCWARRLAYDCCDGKYHTRILGNLNAEHVQQIVFTIFCSLCLLDEYYGLGAHMYNIDSGFLETGFKVS